MTKRGQCDRSGHNRRTCPSTFTVIALALCSLSTAVAAAEDDVLKSYGNQPYTMEEFFRARCATSRNSETWAFWRGTSFASVPQQKQVPLFGVVGANVARCWWEPQAGGWVLTSRELEYYIDPKTGAPISRWLNPWTNATVPVMHVANSPVQGQFYNGSVGGAVITGQVNFDTTYNIYYPNALAANPKFKKYSWQKNYESSELFAYFTPQAELADAHSTSAPGMHFTWTRTSQWLPWMAMDGLDGRLIFTAAGSKAKKQECSLQYSRSRNSYILCCCRVCALVKALCAIRARWG